MKTCYELTDKNMNPQAHNDRVNKLQAYYKAMFRILDSYHATDMIDCMHADMLIAKGSSKNERFCRICKTIKDYRRFSNAAGSKNVCLVCYPKNKRYYEKREKLLTGELK